MNSSEELDLGELVLRLWARRWLLLVFVVVFAAGSIAVAFLLTPMYRSTVVMVPAGAGKEGMSGLGSALGQLGGLASLAGVRVGANDTQTQEAIAVLESREFTEAFINDRALLPELFYSDWDKANKRWIHEHTLVQGFKRFDAIRTVTKDKETGLVRLEILWRDPMRAAAWANALVERLNAEMRARAITRSRDSLGFFEAELARTATIETRQAISRLMESQINERMLANTTQEYAFRVVDRALPADRRDVARPNKPLLVILGSLAGLVLGASYVFASAALRGSRSRSPS